MMNSNPDDLDSSDEDDQFPPSQVFLNNEASKNTTANVTAQGSSSKAAKLDQLLKVSFPSLRARYIYEIFANTKHVYLFL